MMKKVLFLLSLTFLFAVSCGDNGSKSTQRYYGSTPYTSDSGNTQEETDQPDSGNSTETAEQTDSGSDTAAEESQEKPDADGNSEGSDGNNEEPAAEKFCQYACKTASDCVQGGASAINDEDNYKCENSKCVYLGCLSDTECDEVYSAVTQATGRVYRCNKNGAYGYPECTPACSNTAECDLYGQGTSTQYAYDFDNYKCENGMCVFTGCNSDAECETSMNSSNYKCIEQDFSGKTLKSCNIPCKTAADCANSVYPEEFYECKNSQCIAKSCESDEWCAEYMTDDYLCL